MSEGCGSSGGAGDCGSGNGEEGGSCSSERMTKAQLAVLPTCFNCKVSKGVVLGRRDTLCKECFITFFSSHVKNNLSRTFKLRKGAQVLMAYSGGQCSTAALNIMAQAISQSAVRRMFFSGTVVHVDTSSALSLPPAEREEILTTVRATVERFGFPLIIFPLENLFLSAEISSPEEATEQLQSLFANAKSITAKEDLLRSLIDRAMREVAIRENLDKLIVGDSAGTLAIRVLSDTSKGRGFSLPLSLQRADARRFGPNAPVCLRPMADVLPKEIAYYNHIHGLHPVPIPTFTTKGKHGCSIGHLTEEFVNMLQSEYPMTILTILRTSEKIVTPLPAADVSADAAAAPASSSAAAAVEVEDDAQSVSSQASSLSKGGKGSAKGHPPSAVDSAFKDAKDAFNAGECYCSLCGDPLPPLSSAPASTPLSATLSSSSSSAPSDLCYACRIVLKDCTPTAPSLLPPPLSSSRLQSMSRSQMRDEIAEFLLPGAEE